MHCAEILRSRYLRVFAHRVLASYKCGVDGDLASQTWTKTAVFIFATHAKLLYPPALRNQVFFAVHKGGQLQIFSLCGGAFRRPCMLDVFG